MSFEREVPSPYDTVSAQLHVFLLGELHTLSDALLWSLSAFTSAAARVNIILLDLFF